MSTELYDVDFDPKNVDFDPKNVDFDPKNVDFDPLKPSCDAGFRLPKNVFKNVFKKTRAATSVDNFQNLTRERMFSGPCTTGKKT